MSNWDKGENWGVKNDLVVTEGISTEPKWPEYDGEKVLGLTEVVGWDLASGPDIAIAQFEIDGQIVNARVVGDLAIHDSVGNPDHFNIVHVPTLTSFMKAVPVQDDLEYEEEALVSWCQKVQGSYPQFWQVLRELTPLTVKRNTDREMKAKDKIKEWCLSVPIKSNKEW